MAPRITLSTTSLAIVSALICIGASQAIAEERKQIPNMKVISSDASSQFFPLAVGKSLVIDLLEDASEVLVANPRIVNAVQRSKRRAFLIGTGTGQTNVFFYNQDGREIAALDVLVTAAPSVSKGFKQVVVFRGASGGRTTQNCSQSVCLTSPPEPLPDLPPGYTNISHDSIR